MPRPGTPLIPTGSLSAGRDLSRAAMPARCLIEREQPPGDFDPDTGLHDPPGGWATVDQPADVTDDLGHVPARIHPVPLNEDRHTVAEEDLSVSRYYARLPLDTVIRRNHRIRVVSVDPELGDPRQVGRIYRAIDPTTRAFATDARITVKEQVDSDGEV